MAKEFKRSSKDAKDKRSASGKGKEPKKGKKPSFERYRDDSRPSDFGSSSSRRTSSSDERKRPAFPRKREEDHNDSGEEKTSYKERTERSKDSKRSFEDKPTRKTAAEKGGAKEERSFNKERSPRYNDNKRKSYGDKPAFAKKRSGESKSVDEKPSDKKYNNDDFYESKPSFVRESDKKDFDYEADYQAKKKGGSFTKREEGREERTSGKERDNFSRPYKKRAFEKKSYSKKESGPAAKSNNDGTVRLNKYIANAGICSRREADELIESGVVQVNGKIITEMGFKVKPTDVIKYGGQTLKKEKLVYLILNKPKDYITTVDDPQQRRTVLELIQGACRERIYPVGRLDRATTGLLMFTNDGELTKKLTHPRYGVRKVYHVELDKPLKRSDLDKIAEGLELEDGPVKVDEISYVGDGKDKANVGVELHSGKNRIVRRIFEHMGYNVRKLDRVVFGPLTKKDMPRGRWRFLTEAEVGMLKMISSE
jgi:23S rRNA pseudouridine2605 synthase